MENKAIVSICGPLKSSLLHLHTNSSHLLFYPLLQLSPPTMPFHATLGYVLQCYAKIYGQELSPFRIFPLNCYIFKGYWVPEVPLALGLNSPPLKHHIDFLILPLSLLVNLSTFSCISGSRSATIFLKVKMLYYVWLNFFTDSVFSYSVVYLLFNSPFTPLLLSFSLYYSLKIFLALACYLIKNWITNPSCMSF